MSIDKTPVSLESRLKSRAPVPVSWEAPEQFDLSDPIARREITRRLEDGVITSVVDRAPEIADELFELRYSKRKDNETERKAYVAEMLGKGAAFGQWFSFGDGSLVRYPDKQDHRDLITFRNKHLVTEDEQARLLDSTVAVFGLSVGRSVVDSLVLSGIGGRIIMGDFDKYSVTNGNRVPEPMESVGAYKIDLAARKISRANPYIEQIHFREGANEESLAHFSELKTDVMFDEIDSLGEKLRLRKTAQKHGIPLVMVTDIGNRSIVDVERYDLEGTQPFLGKLKKRQLEALMDASIDPKEKQKLMVRIVGVNNLTTRLLQSVMDSDLGGLPQLGVTAQIGGAVGAIAAREIILGRKLQTGRYKIDPAASLKLKSPSTFSESVAAVKQFITAKRS